MCVQLKLLVYLYVYTIIITRIFVCLQNINNSEKHLKIFKRNLLQTTKTKLCYKQNRRLFY